MDEALFGILVLKKEDIMNSPKICVFRVSDQVRHQPINTDTETVSWLALLYEPRCEKTGLRGFRPGPTQTRLYSHRRWLEA